MFGVGQITAVNHGTGEVQIQSAQLGNLVSHLSPLILGSESVGIQYMPKIGDFVFLDTSDNHHTYIVGTYIPPNKLQQNAVINNPLGGFNSIVTKINPGLLPLNQDEIILFNSSGACIKLGFGGTIHICPGGSGTVKIHNLEVDNIKTNMQGV